MNSIEKDALASLPATGEPVAWMWQHEETCRVGFVDAWQVENGWEKGNPRLKLIKPVFAATVDRDAIIEECAKLCEQHSYHPTDEASIHRSICADKIRALKSAPTVSQDDKRDAERYRWIRSCGDEFDQLSILDYRGRIDAEALDAAIDQAIREGK